MNSRPSVVDSNAYLRPYYACRRAPLSALIDGGNNVGYVSCHRGTRLAIDKAKLSGFCSVGVYGLNPNRSPPDQVRGGL